MIPFSQTEYAKGASPQAIAFVEHLASSREKNFQDRLDKAVIASGASKDIFEAGACRDLLHKYLSYYLYNNKTQLLIGKQIQLWRTQKLIMDGDDPSKIDHQEKMSDFCEKLEASIERLYNEIYGAKEIQDIAKEEIKKVISPEARIKKRMREPVIVNEDNPLEG